MVDETLRHNGPWPDPPGSPEPWEDCGSDDDFYDQQLAEYREQKARREAPGQLGHWIERVRKSMLAAATEAQKRSVPPGNVSVDYLSLQFILEAADVEHRRQLTRSKQSITDDELRDAWRRHPIGTYGERIAQVVADDEINGRRGASVIQVRRRLGDMGFEPTGERRKGPERTCRTCGVKFNSRVKFNDTRCDKHRG